MPTEAELIRFYEREYRLRQKGAAEPRPRNVERNLKRSAERLAQIKPLLRPGARILDVGSGAGDFAHLATKAGFEVRAIEPNLAYAEWSKRAFGIDVTIGTWETIDALPHSFDLIMSHHVLEHLRSPFAALKRFHEWLRPGGLLWFAVPNLKNPDASPLSRFQFWHVHGFTPETHQMMSLKAGFVRHCDASADGTEALLKRLPTPAKDWFIFPHHARDMQEFLRQHTFLRYLRHRSAYSRAAWHLLCAVGSRLAQRRF